MDKIIEAMKDIVQEVGGFLLRNFKERGGLELVKKERRNFSLKIDRLAENLIITRLREKGVKADILTEEAGKLSLGRSGYKIYIDPLDGTANYFYGIAHFSTNMALQKGSEVIFGMVHDPFHKETFLAERGGGAFLNGKEIRVGNRSNLGWCCISFLPNLDRATALRILEKIKGVRKLRILGCAGLDLCYTACGRFDGIIILSSRPWDIAAGSLIVEEAGGVITDLEGNGWDPAMKDLLAANPQIHEKLLRLMRG